MDDDDNTGTPEDRGDIMPDQAPEPKTEQKATPAKPLPKTREEAQGELFEKTDDEKEAEAAAAEGEEDEEKSEDKPNGKAKDTRIPLSRHKEVLEKERARRAEIEQKLAQYQRGGEVASLNQTITEAENRVITMEKEYTTLLADGELDKAAAKMSEIRKLDRSMAEARSDMKIAAAESRATERARFNVVLERIESAYPELNPDSDDYDQEISNEVVELKEAYEMKGLTPTAAMQKAVEKELGKRTSKQAAAIETTPRVSVKEIAAERKTAAVKKTADAVAKTPPSSAKVGLDSDRLGGGALSPEAVLKMSQKDFAKLDEETLSRMRGDVVA